MEGKGYRVVNGVFSQRQGFTFLETKEGKKQKTQHRPETFSSAAKHGYLCSKVYLHPLEHADRTYNTEYESCTMCHKILDICYTQYL